MPPPKKPKSGPTTVEQFLSEEELTSLQKCDQQQGNKSKATEGSVENKTSHTDSNFNQKEENGKTPSNSNNNNSSSSTSSSSSNKTSSKGHFHILRELFSQGDSEDGENNARKNETANDSGPEEKMYSAAETKDLAASHFSYANAVTTTDVKLSQTPSEDAERRRTHIWQDPHREEKSYIWNPPHHEKESLASYDQTFSYLPLKCTSTLTSTSRKNTSNENSFPAPEVSGALQLPPYLQDSLFLPNARYALRNSNTEPYDLSVKGSNLTDKGSSSDYSSDKLNLSVAMMVAMTSIQHTSTSENHDKPHTMGSGMYLSEMHVSPSTSVSQAGFIGDRGKQQQLQQQGPSAITQASSSPHIMSILTSKQTVPAGEHHAHPVTLARSSVSTDSGISVKESLPDSPTGDTAGAKSPKEDGCLLGPGECMQVAGLLPVNTHAQAPTSTTPVGLRSNKEDGRIVMPGLGECLQLPGLGIANSHNQAPTSTTPEGLESKFRPPLSIEPHGLIDENKPKQEISGSTNSVLKVCQVCNDNASGFHYGVWSCEGCKAFFKRSIQGPVDYVCPATDSCTIDKHRRKSCQACRLRKCYEVGMNKGSQRKERKSSGSNVGKGKRCRQADSTDGTVNSTSWIPTTKCAKRSRYMSILEALKKADLPVLQSYHNQNLPPTRIHLLNTLVKLADRELVYLINWAKHVPGYTDLSLTDQVHLIECCWMELLLLNCAFRSMEHDGNHLVFAPDFLLDRTHWNVTGMSDILERVGAVSEQMVQYRINKDELLLLQATVLVNAEIRRLASSGKIQEMREMILNALMEVSHKYHPDNHQHFASMLLLLTHIRQAGERGIAYFQQLKRDGCVTFCDLLTEMLDAHNSTIERKHEAEQLN